MRSAMRYMILALLICGWQQAAAIAQESAESCAGGKLTSPVKIEVFSDFQCPSCREFYLNTMRQVFTNYADAGKVCVVYREFPLTNIHPHAFEAARYGHAALGLGPRQWSLVADALFSAQDKWSKDGQIEPVLSSALNAEDLGKLKEKMKDPSIEAAITRDTEMARARQVTATPTFFVTGKGKTQKIVGVVQYPILSRFLDSLLTP
ncbi:MAG: hypothetical protein A3F68_07340 [Acidobacteria bacterium RIFCSPLOWO2_12_FULL_54_10]|nr:MAG: hypothetical protein A3F68_07340 [Acidobacteria bacterium RIFCSPLOWO2_12_FULL_54_10]